MTWIGMIEAVEGDEARRRSRTGWRCTKWE